MRLQDLMQRMRHLPVGEQVDNLNVLLREHYVYFDIAGNFRALLVQNLQPIHWLGLSSSSLASGRSIVSKSSVNQR
jgi:hypothetical protein